MNAVIDSAARRGKAILALLLCVVAIGCDRTYSPEEIVQAAEKKVEHCRDHICEGDVLPKRDRKTEVVLKLNNQFFIGPNEYFSGGSNGAAFYWPSKTPAGRSHAEKGAPEFIPSGPGRLSNFSDVAIEIFFRSNQNRSSNAPSRYQELLRAEKEGRLVSKKTLRQDLEVWHIRMNDGRRDGIWYVATKLKGSDGDAPVLWCDQNDAKYDRCTTAFWWEPGIAVDMRFRAKHGPDWPDIYQETMHVLSLLKKRVKS